MYRVMHKFIVFLCFTLLTLATTINASTESLRKQFLEAESLLKQNKTEAYAKLRAQLDEYPLAPYLDYQEILKNLTNSKPEKINAFIEKNHELPIAQRLNKTWLKHLNRQKEWNSYSQHFSLHPIDHTHYQCMQLQAFLNGTAKQKKEALYKAKELWVVGKSQPKTCDPLFKEWMATGRPTSNEAFERFWLSIEENNIKLARYIDKKITNKKQKQQIQQFWALYNKPESISKKALSLLPKENRGKVAKLIYKRWYRTQPISATQAWVKVRNKLMSQEEQLSVTEYMGIRLNANYHSQAIKLSHLLDPEYKIEPLTETRIRNALAKQDWKTVQIGIAHLSEKGKADPKWQYWNLIAERNLSPDKNQAKQQLADLSKDRSFYGFLAAELNKSPFQLNAIDEPLSSEQLTQLSNKPAVARARELFKLGRLIEANREWNLALSKMTPEEKNIAGYLAKSWGWYLQAIINAAKTERWDHIDLRFPQPHSKLFKTHALKNELDLSFPMAIARQESAFLYNAQSRVGARGLMQLMPKTAKQTAQKHKVPYKKTSQLYDPETNITLGSAYLGDMLKRFDNNPAFAAAAYNAGPHRVKRWLQQRGDLPLDIWIETIPFKETRRYVQNVLAFRVIYDRLAGREASLLTEKQIELLALNQNKATAL
jgi:soluble lytic murein transglycosylase